MHLEVFAQLISCCCHCCRRYRRYRVWFRRSGPHEDREASCGSAEYRITIATLQPIFRLHEGHVIEERVVCV